MYYRINFRDVINVVLEVWTNIWRILIPTLNVFARKCEIAVILNY